MRSRKASSTQLRILLSGDLPMISAYNQKGIRIALLVFTVAVSLTFQAFAHEIPNDVTAQVFLKPEANRLVLLARVPLRACRDAEFPTRGPGYIDLARADQALRDAATVWIS